MMMLHALPRYPVVPTGSVPLLPPMPRPKRRLTPRRALAGTWDTELVGEMAAANAEATRALGMDMYFYVINLWADPRFGRQEEGFSVRTTSVLCRELLGSTDPTPVAAADRRSRR